MTRALVPTLVALAACGNDPVTVAPVIDTDGSVFADLDEVEVSLAHDGSAEDLVSTTFARGEPIELADVPYGDDLVIHMIGRRSGSEVAAGRTCSFDLIEGEPPPAPHLYFAHTVSWATGPQPASPDRTLGTAITYADDGSGLYLAGGLGPGDVGPPPAAQDIDRFDPRTGAFSVLGTLSARFDAVVAQLDGPVAVMGGVDATTLMPTPLLELVTVGGPGVQRIEAATGRLDVDLPAVASLTDGRAVLFGGRDATGTASGRVVEIAPDGPSATVRLVTTPGGHLTFPRFGHTATRLSNDVGAPILIAGGTDSAVPPNVVAVAELYFPLQEAFADPASFAPPMVVPRRLHQSIRLPDSTALIVGGVDDTGAPVATLERFSIIAGFTEVGTLPSDAGLNGESITPLPDGRLLLAGGTDIDGNVVDTAYIVRLDPIDGVVDVSPTERLMTPRSGHQATLLCDGTVLLVGGTTSVAAAERYNPPSIGRR